MNQSVLMNLTWEDLNEWAGERIVSRGKSYRRRVEDICITPDAALVATVYGTEEYSTRAGIDANDELFSECTCPYSWGPCKHAVAVILVYLDACKAKKKIPITEKDDERLLELSGEYNDCDDWDYEDSENDDEIVSYEKRLPSKLNGVRSHLEALSKKELVDLLMKGENIIPDLSRKLADSDHLKKGDIDKLVKAIRREIKIISSEPAWSNHWDGEHNIPDYSPVKKRLKTLLSNNHADVVVELGAYLMERGIQQIEQSNDEGETGEKIASCMEVVYKAIMQSSLSIPQRLLWEIDLNLQDEYSILDGLEGPLDTGMASSSDWSEVADVLSGRMDKLPKRQAGKEDDFSTKYRHKKVMRWLLHALEEANRKDEINRILERETTHTDCYVELVERLIQGKQIEKACEWAHKGYTETLENAPGIAAKLEELLREMALSENNYPLAAAHTAFEFFNRPDIEKYTQIEDIATKAGVWPSVKKHVFLFLEKGDRPDLNTKPGKQAKRKSSHKIRSASQKTDSTKWPLPILQLPVHDRFSRWSNFPDTETLIDIAIREKRQDDILKWYCLSKKSGGFMRDHAGNKVAEAVQTSHPDEALSIWKAMADQEISRAKPAAYQTAGHYLKKIKAVYSRENNEAAWNQYMAELREHNKRRPRMLDVLNSLEGRRTRIVQ